MTWCKNTLPITPFILLLILTHGLAAQMLPNRQQRRPAMWRGGAAANQDQADIGSLRGNERFMRRSRRPDEFVGPDVREIERFIGAIQGTMRSQSNLSTDSVRRRVDRSQTLNQPLPIVPSTGVYNPRINVDAADSGLSPPNTEAVAANALASLT